MPFPPVRVLNGTGPSAQEHPRQRRVVELELDCGMNKRTKN
jgi:hypothetical protein